MLTLTPCFAADNSAAAPSNSTGNASQTGKAKGGPPGGHARAFGKRVVLELSSLTDKQKQQINAVYDGNKAQSDALQKQMRALHESEWSKVKAFLTPEQITELQSERHKRGRDSGERESSTESN